MLHVEIKPESSREPPECEVILSLEMNSKVEFGTRMSITGGLTTYDWIKVENLHFHILLLNLKVQLSGLVLCVSEVIFWVHELMLWVPACWMSGLLAGLLAGWLACWLAC